MGTLASSRMIYGNAEITEENGISSGNSSGVANYKYANEGEQEDISVNVPSSNESVTVMVEKGASKKIDVVPLITGGALAYLAHSKFKSKKFSWAYVLGGFTIGYFGGSFVSNKLIKK